jgi:predicted ArsR family transcriptional regulator
VDRLSLFKMLADRSRYAIYQEVAAAREPMTTMQLATRLELHPNTVRLHLEKMREAGLLAVTSDRHGTVGRPQHRWAAVPLPSSLDPEPAGFRLLALLLAEVAAEGHPAAAAVTGVGRRRGRERSGDAWRSEPGAACVRAVMDELTNLGFDPALHAAPEEGQATISFLRCPFREVAVLYPDLVCQLHRGLTEGILAGAVTMSAGAEGRVESFASLVDADPCRVELSVRS